MVLGLRSPFAISRTEKEASVPPSPHQETHTYASPNITEGDAYITAQGWAPVLRTTPWGIPDSHRLGTEPLRDFETGGNPASPPEVFAQKRGGEINLRHSSQESVSSVGWQEHKGIGTERRYVDNPRTVPPPETRVTMLLAARDYLFTRPYGQATPHRFNGLHFSMADHRRDYGVRGMAPQRMPGVGTRNTYRTEPTPWDTDIVDLPPVTDPAPGQRIVSTEVPRYQSGSYRL